MRFTKMGHGVVVGFVDHDRQNYAEAAPIAEAGEFNVGLYLDDGSTAPGGDRIAGAGAAVRPPFEDDGRADGPPWGTAARGRIAPVDRDEAEGTGTAITISRAVVVAPSGGPRLSKSCQPRLTKTANYGLLTS